MFSTDPSGQILSLCEQINRQGSHPDPVSNLPAPTSSGFVTNNVQPHPSFNPSFQQSPQVQQQQQFGGVLTSFCYNFCCDFFHSFAHFFLLVMNMLLKFVCDRIFFFLQMNISFRCCVCSVTSSFTTESSVFHAAANDATSANDANWTKCFYAATTIRRTCRSQHSRKS